MYSDPTIIVDNDILISIYRQHSTVVTSFKTYVILLSLGQTNEVIRLTQVNNEFLPK